MEQKNNLFEILLNTLIIGDMKKIIEASSEYLNYPIMLVDAKYNCLAHYPEQEIGDPLWDSIHQNETPTIEFINKLNDENMMMLSAKKEPYFINWGFLTNNPRIVVNIIVNKRCIGYLAIITDVFNDYTIEQAKLISETI